MHQVLTERLDLIASELEKSGHIKLALNLDHISDALEKISWEKRREPITHKPGDPPNLLMTGDPLFREVYDYKHIMEQLKDRKKQ